MPRSMLPRPEEILPGFPIGQKEQRIDDTECSNDTEGADEGTCESDAERAEWRIHGSFERRFLAARRRASLEREDRGGPEKDGARDASLGANSALLGEPCG